MRDNLFHIERNSEMTLQAQIREFLMTAVLKGHLSPGESVPSTRMLAQKLKVSRNTVTSSYQALVSDGLLTTKQRSGYYVSDDINDLALAMPTIPDSFADIEGSKVDWQNRLTSKPSTQKNIAKPANWHSYKYPFIYGQADASLFPINAWRDCVRKAMGTRWLEDWTDDRFAEDDPMLVDQIRQRILPRRGILVERDHILVTMGAQNAIYLLATLLCSPNTKVTFEDPGYPDARNIFSLFTSGVQTVSVDQEGMVVEEMPKASLAYVTPSHQYPTNVTMSLERRKQLLRWADDNDAVVIEDDYEFETNFLGTPTPALASFSKSGRIIYVGSLSKSLMPGLRIGFLVAPPELIREIRALRRLMLRHPPGNNQRAVAMFLASGHHDAMIHRLHRSYLERWHIMDEALNKHLPGWAQPAAFGGTSFWVKGPDNLDARELGRMSQEQGVLIEHGDVNFARPNLAKNYFKLAFSSISAEKIEPGLKKLASCFHEIGK